MTNLSTKRHSLAHIMAQAVKENYPEAKIATGPDTDDGFYYDFDFGEIEFSEKELKKIEKSMKKIITQNQDFKKFETSYDDAKNILDKMGEGFKKELIAKFESGDFKNSEKISDKITFYYNISKGKTKFEDLQNFLEENNFVKFDELDGDQTKNLKFIDMCVGPHVENTKELDANSFKLAKVSGAYWLGDENNKQLTRIYAYGFENKEELDKYLKFIEEAKKRDHRNIGPKMGLYTIDPDVGIGLPLWKPAGAHIVNKIKRWFEDEQIKRGYLPVLTPHIGRKSLWETSGHWGFYNESMYPPIELGQTLEDYQDNRKPKETETYLLKPMNCPFHIKIYNSDKHSYRELPIRYYEFGTVYRYEKKGELGGLTRVRGFTQDDAHIIATREDLEEEFEKVIDFSYFVLETFGYKIKPFLSLRDPKNKQKYLGDDEMWEVAENTVRKILKKKNIDFVEETGEAAFYGPKVDLKVEDSLGRKWQLSTVQFDFNLPEKFDISFTNKDGEEEKPFIIHRALLGSIERFMGILIEHFSGSFPLWLSPRQVIILPVSDEFLDYSKKINEELKLSGINSSIDFTNNSLNKKIRTAELSKINYILIIGEEEEKNKTVSFRNYKTKEQSVEKIKDFKDRILEEIKEQRL